MMRLYVALGLFTLVLMGGTDAPHAQPGVPPDRQNLPYPQDPMGLQAANICTTQWGWCNLPTLSNPGFGCACLTAQNQQVPGVTRSYPYQGPTSPYLRPHTSAPQMIR